MRKNKIAVYVLSALLTLVAAAVVYYQEQWEDFPLTVIVESEAGREKIQSWKRIPSTFYMFLPGYTDPEGAKIQTNWLHPIAIEGERVGKDASCADYPFNVPLRMTYSNRGKTIEQTLIFTQSSGVDTLYIDTASGSMDYIHEEKGNAEGGRLRLYSPEGLLESSAQIRAINGRGNSTWDPDKKPYSIELSDRTDLLGMGAAKKWILLANYYDASHMDNKMCFDFARRVGCAYTPECQWVDLYLNGNYAGLYLLSERNEVDSQRVDIPKEDSFLISMEYAPRWTGRHYAAFFTRRDNFQRIHHAGMEEARIQKIWQSVEDSLFAQDGIDPFTGESWDRLIDVDSWARQCLLWEVFEELDAGAMSQFFYYDGESNRVYSGPVWDYDIILSIYGLHPPNILASQRRYIWNRDQESMFYRLWQMDSFRERVTELYWEEYRALALELANTGMDAYLEQIRQAVYLNELRWDGNDTAKAVQEKKNYLLERIAFLDEYWTSPEDYCVIEVFADSQWRSFAVKCGQSADFLSSEGITWLDYETGEPFDITAPVTRDCVIRGIADGDEEE